MRVTRIKRTKVNFRLKMLVAAKEKVNVNK
jgi:hypothetical protein